MSIKFLLKFKGPIKTKAIVKNILGEFKATVIRRVWHWHNNSPMELKSPKTDPRINTHLNYNKGTNALL